MIIEKINIKSFGMIRDMTLEFSPTVNVIEGQNEAGKSTIAAFIKYMLYGFDAEDGEDGDGERRRRLNWEDGTASGSMTVLVKDKRYLISRATTTVTTAPRPTYREESAIIDAETGSPAFGKVPAGEVFFGVDKELFENTAFIGQIGDSAIDRGSVKESIENILFSGSERINNQRAAQKVSEKMQSLLHKSGAGGAIVELSRRSAELGERYRRANEDNRRILAKEAELHELRTEIEKEKKNEAKLTELDRCYENMMIIRSFDELHEYEKRADEKAEEYQSFISKNTKCGFVPSAKYLTELSVARRGVDDSYRALTEAENDYEVSKSAVGITHEIENSIAASDEHGGEAAVVAKGSSHVRGMVKTIAAAVLAALAVIAVAVVEIIASGVLAHVAMRVLFALLGFAALDFGAIMLIMANKSKNDLAALCSDFGTGSFADLRGKMAVIGEARKKRDDMIETIENARKAELRCREDFERAQKELADTAARWGGKLPSENANKYLDKLEDNVRAFLDEEGRLRGEKTELEIVVRETRRSLAGKSEVSIRAQVSPLKRKVLSEIDHEGILLGIEQCREKAEAYSEKVKALEEELAELKLHATDHAVIYSKMQANDRKIAELREQYEAYSIALDAINSASAELRREISPRLGEYSTELMEIMTDRKYTGIDVSDGLKVTFLAPTGEQKPVDFLSGGTRDLTYIAVRMALIDMLYGEKPPICFDESFAHQDNVRARSMMRAVKHLADEGCQSFIFTCRAREAGLAREAAKKTAVFRLSAAEDAIN